MDSFGTVAWILRPTAQTAMARTHNRDDGNEQNLTDDFSSHRRLRDEPPTAAAAGLMEYEEEENGTGKLVHIVEAHLDGLGLRGTRPGAGPLPDTDHGEEVVNDFTAVVVVTGFRFFGWRPPSAASRLSQLKRQTICCHACAIQLQRAARARLTPLNPPPPVTRALFSCKGLRVRV
ncbi:hypothetical protein niasHT_009490 [Heterodera trifolii]|uniref:Uncharacterized protein n=1 Tax=Heterodera trifolii TaxID=157864 RepID=A0ABD2M765_9BILA